MPLFWLPTSKSQAPHGAHDADAIGSISGYEAVKRSSITESGGDSKRSQSHLEDAKQSESEASDMTSTLDDDNSDVENARRARLRRCLVPSCIVLLLVVAVTFAAAQPKRTLRAAVAMLDGLRSLGPAAPVAVIGVQIVLVVCALPSWFIWVGAGTLFTLVWGQAVGLLIALASVGSGVWVGSVFAFALGRTCFRPLISEWTAERPMFRAIDLAVSERGLQVGFLIKLSPVFPLNVMNYVLAITQISPFNFVVTCSGSLLSVTVYVLVGASLSSLAAIDSVGASGSKSRRTMTIITIVGCLVGAVSLVYVMRASRKAYAELMARAAAASELLAEDLERLAEEEGARHAREAEDADDADAVERGESGAYAGSLRPPQEDEHAALAHVPSLPLVADDRPLAGGVDEQPQPAASAREVPLSRLLSNMTLDPKYHGTERDPLVIYSARSGRSSLNGSPVRPASARPSARAMARAAMLSPGRPPGLASTLPAPRSAFRTPASALAAGKGSPVRPASARAAPRPPTQGGKTLSHFRRSAGDGLSDAEPLRSGEAFAAVVPSDTTPLAAKQASNGADEAPRAGARMVRTMTAPTTRAEQRTPMRTMRLAALKRANTSTNLLMAAAEQRQRVSLSSPAPAQPRLIDRVFRSFLEPALVPTTPIKSPIRLNRRLLNRVSRQNSGTAGGPTRAQRRSQRGHSLPSHALPSRQASRAQMPLSSRRSPARSPMRSPKLQSAEAPPILNRPNSKASESESIEFSA